MRPLNIGWFLITIFYTNVCFAQNFVPIDGPNDVMVGDTSVYIIQASDIAGVDWDMTFCDECEVLLQDFYSITVKWHSQGTCRIDVHYYINGDQWYYSDRSVSVHPAMSGGTIATTLNEVVYNTAAPVISNISNATGGFGPADPVYSWQRSRDGINWETVSVMSGPSYQDQDHIKIKTYYRRTAYQNDHTVYSNVVSVDVIPLLKGGRIAASQVVNPQDPPGQLTNIISASGGTGIYSYQWEYSYDELNWNIVATAASDTYQPVAATQTIYYRRKVISGDQFRYSNTIQILAKNNITYNTPDGTIPIVTEPLHDIPVYNSVDAGNINAITTYTVFKPGISDNSELGALDFSSEAQKTTTYLDGLGRAIQTVAEKASVEQKDIIGIDVYDPFGRETTRFLPYPATTDNTNAGKFRSDVRTAQPGFYDWLYADDGEDYYYTNVTAEDAIISRYRKTTIPGKAYSGGNVGAIVQTRTNYGYENVRIWTIGDNETDLPQSTGVYAGGTLHVSVYTDEQAAKVYEYTDLEGKLILKVVQATGAATDGEGLRTYYIYDGMRHLRCIIPPLAEKYCEANSTWTLPASIASSLCYRYFYDAKGRLISRWIPGKQGYTYMVYDVRDRLVFLQDPLLDDQGNWMMYLYDAQDRPTTTALYHNASATRESLQQLLDQSGENYVKDIPPAPAVSDLYIDQQDPQVDHYEASHSITFGEGYTSISLSHLTVMVYPGGGTPGSVIVFNPGPEVPAYEPITITHYDNYNWQGAGTFNTDFTVNADNNPYPEPVQPAPLVHGAVTGTEVKVAGQEKWLKTTFFYDRRGRLIQSQRQNITGGLDITTNQYDFSGKLLSSYLLHENSQSALTPTTRILLRYAYDVTGKRLTNVYQTIYTAASPVEKLVATYTYDPLGRLQSKTLGSDLETLNYTYYLQNWLVGINADFVEDKQTDHYFGQQLVYDRGFSEDRFDGTIAGVQWRRKGNADEAHAYGYIYDAAGRMDRADYSQNEDGVWTNTKADYTVNVSGYDENGNIGHLKREGMLPGNAKATFDDLSYEYGNNNNSYSNQLWNITDAAGNQRSGDLNDGNLKTTTGLNDYVYDDNGNLIQDRNRGVTLTYNYVLDKPDKITLDSDPTNKYIQYVYSYDGSLLQKIVKNGSSLNTYTYINGFTYKNDTLQYFLQPEGRVRYTPEQDANGDYTGNYTYQYDYFLTDHLGNVRTVLTEEQLTDKYPAATMEDSRQTGEQAYYDITDGRRVLKSQTGATQSSFEDKLYRTNGANNEKTGLGITLKVMAGDQVYIRAESFYQQPGTDLGDPLPLIVENLADALINTAGVAASGKNITSATITGNPVNANDLDDFLHNTDHTPPNNLIPRAYLNWVLFDEQFQFVAGGSDPVNPSGGYKLHDAFLNSPVQVTKNGYLFVYVSNESNLDVYFDNLQLTHVRGPLLQEDTYYPFGMNIAALSSHASGRLANGYKYNGIMEEDNFELSLYDAFYRTLDPQVGRWWQIDPMAEKLASLTPYNSNFNNPINFSDPYGDFPGPPTGWLRSVISTFKSAWGGIKTALGGSPKVDYNLNLPEVVVTAKMPDRAADMLGRTFTTDDFLQLGSLAARAASGAGSDQLSQTHRLPLQIKPLPSGTISPYKPDLIDSWSESSNSVARMTYMPIDNIWVNLQNLNPLDDQVAHLNGSLTNNNERVDAFVGTTSDVVASIIGEKILAGIGSFLFRRFATREIGFLFRGGRIAKASELVSYAKKQGWEAIQNIDGPLKYIDENGIIRMTIKRGSPRAPASNFPHVELRNAAGKRIDPFGNEVTRKSLENHTKIIYDL